MLITSPCQYHSPDDKKRCEEFVLLTDEGVPMLLICLGGGPWARKVKDPCFVLMNMIHVSYV